MATPRYRTHILVMHPRYVGDWRTRSHVGGSQTDLGHFRAPHRCDLRQGRASDTLIQKASASEQGVPTPVISRDFPIPIVMKHRILRVLADLRAGPFVVKLEQALRAESA